MKAGNDVIEDVIRQVVGDNTQFGEADFRRCVYKILNRLGITVVGQTARREGRIVPIGTTLALAFREADGDKLYYLRPGTSIEIYGTDWVRPYLTGTIVKAPIGSPFRQVIEGPDIDDNTDVVGRTARVVIHIGVTDPPAAALDDADMKKLPGPNIDR